MDKINNEGQGKRFKINFKFLFFISVIFIIIFFISWGSITFLTKEVVCGDGICNKDENVENCPEDCIIIPLTNIEEEFALCKMDAEKACLAITSKDMSYCDSINFEVMRDNCLRTTIFLFDIFENKDKASCVKIKEMPSEECSNIIDSIKIEDITNCESEACEYALSLYLANSQKNIDLCEEIADENTKNNCKLYLTSNMDYCDYSYCSDVYNIHMREQTGDLSYCDKVINPSGKQACLGYKKT